MGRILVVDDERSMREFLGICLKRLGHEVSVAKSGQQAAEVLLTTQFDIVLSDLRMPGSMDGLQLLQCVIERKLETEVIVMTAFASAETALSAMKMGAYDYLTKPFKIEVVGSVIARALEKRSLVEANTALRKQVEGRYRLASLIGKSPMMQRVFDLVEKTHSVRTSVLITGESGTGKELVARALHTEGNRNQGEFVAINCGAIPDNLLESELFGHVKGAFTGAHSQRLGLFRKANLGTLFLDEIGDLSLSLQVKLLRVIQERRVRPVGSEEEFDVDVRVLAATNRDLEDEVRSGGFREDLYYRLNVIEIRLPALRHRLSDIVLLSDYFLEKHKGDTSTGLTGFTSEARKRLEQYEYRGNVRELENIVQRAIALSAGPLVDLCDLPSIDASQHFPEQVPQGDIPEEGMDLDRVLSDYERKILRQAMDQSDGVRKKAAALLGISFRSIRYRLTKLGLDSE